MTQYGKVTREEARSTVAAMNDRRRLRFEQFHVAYKKALEERTDPRAPVSPKRVLELVPSNSSSVYYVFLPLMEALEGVDEHEEPVVEEGPGYQPPAALSAIFAPLRQQLELIPQAIDRLMTSTVAGETERVRGSFAQERFSLQEALANSKSRVKDLEDDLLQVAGESDDLAEQLAVSKAEKVAIEEQLATVTEHLSRANSEINDLSIRLHTADARIIGHDDLDKVRGRELEGLLAARNTLQERLDVAEKDLREQQQLRENENRELRKLREEDSERSKSALADLQARHAAEVAALREEFSLGVAAERDRVSQLELALVSALKTAVESAATQDAEAV